MTDKKITTYTARRIRTLRQEKEWSQENLALVAGLSVAYIGQLERQEKAPTIESLDKICKALGVSICRFYNFDEKSTPTEDIHLAAIDTVVNSMKSMPVDLAKRVAYLVQEIEALSK